MKKITLLSLVLLLSIPLSISANTKEEVTLSKCVDGDTARFMIQGEEKSVRFLAINAPEYTKKKEPYGKQASNKVCQLLKNANTIYLEYDDKSSLYDKYGRVLAWVWADNQLIQKVLVKEGYAEVKYLYGDYQYNDELKLLEKKAKKQELGMWQKESLDLIPWWKYILYGIGLFGICFLLIKNKRGNKTKVKTIKKVLKQIEKL